jgi:hypothetical protein
VRQDGLRDELASSVKILLDCGFISIVNFHQDWLRRGYLPFRLYPQNGQWKVNVLGKDVKIVSRKVWESKPPFPFRKGGT